MNRIHKATKLTDNRFLNLYELDASIRGGASGRLMGISQCAQ